MGFFAGLGERRTLFSEVMKNMTRGILFAWAAFAACAIYGGQPAPGVAGVDVVVKQNPSKRVVTDARGNFVLDALPPGFYTLAFRAVKAKDTKAPADKVTIADSYSIKIEGTKRSVNQDGIPSHKLIAGIDIPVEVGSGAKIRGRVAAGGLKRMVWIPKEPGSNIPGHWVAADSPEANAAFHSNAYEVTGDSVRKFLQGTVDDPGTGFPYNPSNGGRP
jgi:hypothetical protein